MTTDEKKSKHIIDALTYGDWQPLLALIPEIEKTTEFGVCKGGGVDENGHLQAHYWHAADIVTQFTEVVYQMPIMINFNWMKWYDGKKMANDKNFDFDTTDLFTKCKLLTARIRNERFSNGALISDFKTGLILKILKSIEKEVVEKESIR